MVETRSSTVDPAWLLAEERSAVANAVASRRQDFVLGRHCARLATVELGMETGPITRGPSGEPQWPHGQVGSITHTTGLAAAAVARSADLSGVGLDAEPNEPLPEGVKRLIIRPEEAERLAMARSHTGPHLDRLLFCAKEAAYKVWFPLAERWLDFMDASVRIEPDNEVSGSFDVEILVDGPIQHLTGRYLSNGSHLLAAIEVLRAETD